MKKYKLIPEKDSDLFRIKAVRDFDNVKKDELGGLVEGEHNLSHSGTCWIKNGAKVYGDAEVLDNAKVYGNSEVSGTSIICNHAYVRGNTIIRGNVVISQSCGVDCCIIDGNIKLEDYVYIEGDIKVFGNFLMVEALRIEGSGTISSLSGFIKGGYNRTKHITPDNYKKYMISKNSY